MFDVAQNTMSEFIGWETQRTGQIDPAALSAMHARELLGDAIYSLVGVYHKLEDDGRNAPLYCAIDFDLVDCDGYYAEYPEENFDGETFLYVGAITPDLRYVLAKVNDRVTGRYGWFSIREIDSFTSIDLVKDFEEHHVLLCACRDLPKVRLITDNTPPAALSEFQECEWADEYSVRVWQSLDQAKGCEADRLRRDAIFEAEHQARLARARA